MSNQETVRKRWIFLSLLGTALFILPLTLQANDQREGAERTYYPNGQLKEETNYHQGKLDGSSKAYYENGAVQRESQYRDGKLEGLGKIYYANGKPKAETHFKDGKRDGAHEVYDEKTGNIILEDTYKNGSLEGVQRMHHPDSKTVLVETWFKNGKKQGPEKFYTPAGKLLMEHNFKNGLEEGEGRSYDILTGRLTEVGYYREGKYHGIVTTYDRYSKEAGKIWRTETYKMGVLDGPTTYYDDRGKVSSIEKYRDGKKV